jgi:flagellar basal-body rod protein FlgG
MEAQQTKLDVTAHNIANVSTNGFKKHRAEFADLIYQQTKAPGAGAPAGGTTPIGIQVGLGVRVNGVQHIHSEGDLRQTGNQLDIAIHGNGFFQIQQPGGTIAYTRDGAFKMDPEGRLVTTEGMALAGDITIPPDATNVTIGADGRVSVTVPGSPTPVEAGQIELATFANPSGLAPQGRNLYTETSASGTPITSNPGEQGVGFVQQGMLELSNVKVVEEMVDLISGQRAYEVNSRVVKAADEMLQQTANLR